MPGKEEQEEGTAWAIPSSCLLDIFPGEITENMEKKCSVGFNEGLMSFWCDMRSFNKSKCSIASTWLKNDAALLWTADINKFNQFSDVFSGSNIPAVSLTTEAAVRHKKDLPILHVLATLPKDSGNTHRVSARLPLLSRQYCMRWRWILPR